MIAPVPVSVSALPPPSEAATALAQELAALLPGRVSLQEQDRLCYARDMWPQGLIWIREGRTPPPPDLVAWPKSEEEIAEVIRLARARKVPVIPFGAGSGVCGGTWAVQGGIALDLKRLEDVGAVDPDRLTVEAGAGVIGEVLERKLNAQGYTLGHFPSSIWMSTLGGWLAARSAGQLSNRYGKIEDMVLSVRAVTGRGELLVTPERPLRGAGPRAAADRLGGHALHLHPREAAGAPAARAPHLPRLQVPHRGAGGRGDPAALPGRAPPRGGAPLRPVRHRARRPREARGPPAHRALAQDRVQARRAARAAPEAEPADARQARAAQPRDRAAPAVPARAAVRGRDRAGDPGGRVRARALPPRRRRRPGRGARAPLAEEALRRLVQDVAGARRERASRTRWRSPAPGTG